MTTASGPESESVFRFDVAEAAGRLSKMQCGWCGGDARPINHPGMQREHVPGRLPASMPVIAPQLHDGAVRPTDDESYEAGAREALRRVRDATFPGSDDRRHVRMIAAEMGVTL